jgi:hypothetical protein
MQIQDFEDYLKKEGCYYYRPNITVHYYQNVEKPCFWGNYKGEETEDFESLKALMETHSWVDIPEQKDL